MVLTTSVIVGRKFNKVIRGYDPRQVDDFLNEIVQGLDRHNRENNTLKKQNIALAENNISLKSKNSVLIESNAALVREVEEFKNSLKKYKDIENITQYSIVSLREVSDEMLRNASLKADIIVNEAKLLASELIANAELEKERMLSQVEQAKQDLDSYKSEIKSSLVHNVEYLSKVEAEAECIDELWIAPHTLGVGIEC